MDVKYTRTSDTTVFYDTTRTSREYALPETGLKLVWKPYTVAQFYIRKNADEYSVAGCYAWAQQHVRLELPDYFKNYSNVTVTASTLKFEGDCRIGWDVDIGGRYSKRFSIPNCSLEQQGNELFWVCESTEFTEGLSTWLKSLSNGVLGDLYNSDCELCVSVSGSLTGSITVNYDKLASPVDWESLTVAEVTESVKPTRFRALTAVNLNNIQTLVLKAFMNFPKTTLDAIYCSWRYTLDGVVWMDAIRAQDGTDVVVEEPSADPIEGVEQYSEGSEVPNASYRFKKLDTTDENDLVISRNDCLIIDRSGGAEIGFTDWDAVAFKFKVCKMSESDTVTATYGEQLFYMTNVTATELEHSEFGNAAAGDKRYIQKRLYSFGHPSFKNNIFYSYPGEFVTPLTNVIELSASSDTIVTSVCAWRDYIVSTTPFAVYVSSKSGDGFLTKAVNTSVGVPELDAKCVVPALNGIVFKSGNKVYQLYPNVYAGDDTVMNVTDVSQGIAHILEAYTPNDSVSPFAFATSFEYVLMLPQETSTLCLRYDFNNRRWTSHEYAAVFDSFYMYSLDNICTYGTNTFGEYCEFMFDSGYEKLPFPDTFTRANELRYGDVLRHASAISEGAYGTTIANTVQDLQAQFNSTYVDTISPIEFELDTGQKADTILTTKQFVETKLVVSTSNKYDKFPMQLVVHVDGDPNIITRDVSTDSAFWKDGSTFGILNTTFNTLSDTSDISGTLRQLVVRYSGKGKSIRHILTGSSFCNFKLYETYVRYKHPNVKQ
jgi:hypothetical protein